MITAVMGHTILQSQQLAAVVCLEQTLFRLCKVCSCRARQGDLAANVGIIHNGMNG